MKLYLFPLLFIGGFAATAQQYHEGPPPYDSAENELIAQQKDIKAHCPWLGCHLIPPCSVITASETQRRIGEFGQKIKNCGLSLDREEDYEPEGALAMLKLMSDKKPGYDGFRAYFAVFPCEPKPNTPDDSGYRYVPHGREGKLTLIYVPTTKNGMWHFDDTTHCIIIVGKTIVNIRSGIASFWIHKADDQVLHHMEKWYRKYVDTDFRETHSLWYSDFFVRPNEIHNGLIDILECRIHCKSVKTVQAEFAGFLTKNKKHRNHQLSLVFQLSKVGMTNDISLQWDDRSGWAKYEFAHELRAYFLSGSGGSDTGNPCPPPYPCNPTNGVLLPSP